MQRACQQHGMTAMVLLLQGAFVACGDQCVVQSFAWNRVACFLQNGSLVDASQWVQEWVS